MTIDEIINIFKREKAHCEDHLHFVGKSEEYYKDIQDLIDAYDVSIKIIKKAKKLKEWQQARDCKTCKHSDKGNCAGTEECHECMWESKYETQPCEDCFTDDEKSMFLTSLAREMKICEQVDIEYPNAKIKLVPIIHSIKEKVLRSSLWKEKIPSVTPKAEAEKEMDCEHCIHTYGTLGCCDMVDNKWVYDCDFGHEQYVKQDIYKAIDELKTISRTGTVEKAATENNINWLKWKIDKLLSDALKEAYIRGYDYGVKDWFSDAKDKINVKEWLDSFNTESATDCFTAVQRLKENMNEN